MRVLIADRNARLLESISRSFGREFAIQAAASCADCKELLSQGEFDLALISEKLADGPGLQLLGQIARDSPDTLRVFVARRARLELLRGKLGPFGLFRTLGYPIDPQELLSVLTLARAGLEVSGWRKPADAPVMAAPTKPATGEPAARELAARELAAEKTKVIKSPVAKAAATGPAVMKFAATKVAATGPAVAKPAATKATATDPAVAKPAATKAAATKPAPAPAGVRATVERISLTSADATFVVDVPKIFASIGQGPRGVRGGRVRAPGNGAPRPNPDAQKSVRDATPDLPRAAGRAQQVASHPPGAAGQAQRVAFDPVAITGQARKVALDPSNVGGQARKGASDPSNVGGQARKGASDSAAAAGRAQRGAPDPSAVAGKAGKFAFDPSNVPGQGLVAASSAPSADPRRTRAQPSAPRSSLSPAAVGSKPRNRGMGSRVEYKAPVRSKVALGATIAVVFVATALTLNWADTSAHVTRAPAPGPTVEQSALAVPPSNPPPVDSKPPFGPTSSVARRVEPKPDPVQSDAEPTGPQIASSATTPVADPSSFGSEAYEIIYSN